MENGLCIETCNAVLLSSPHTLIIIIVIIVWVNQGNQVHVYSIDPETIIICGSWFPTLKSGLGSKSQDILS